MAAESGRSWAAEAEKDLEGHSGTAMKAAEYEVPQSTSQQISRHDHGLSDPEKGAMDAPKQDGSGLNKILSRVSRTSVGEDPGPPPDGGSKAWTQVGLAHLVVFCTWGYINSFGVFQTYYVQHLGHSPSEISWIGSVQIFLLFGIGTFSGRATDAGYYRLVFLSGLSLQLLGVFMTSLSTQYWQLFLAQGICTGLGNGLLFCPTIALIATYFTSKRALALACVASGSGTGGLLFPGIIEALLPKIGFGWTVRVVAFIMLVLSGIAGTFTRTRLPPRKSGPIFEIAAFKEMPYALFALGMFLMFWGIYPAFYYVGEFAATRLGADQATSINLLLVMNGIGIPSRLLPGYLADRYTGPINQLIPFTSAGALLIYSWIAVHNIAGLYGFAAIYGVFGAIMQGLFPAALSSLTTDLKKMGTRIGMVFSIISLGAFTGSPIAGALITHNDDRYLYAQIFSGTSLIAATLMLLASRTASIGWKFKVKI